MSDTPNLNLNRAQTKNGRARTVISKVARGRLEKRVHVRVLVWMGTPQECQEQ